MTDILGFMAWLNSDDLRAFSVLFSMFLPISMLAGLLMVVVLERKYPRGRK